MTRNYRQLARALERQEVQGSDFRHADHVGVAYEMLSDRDFLVATFDYSEAIRKMASAAGAPDKFNMTITVAFMSIIAERMHTTDHDSYDEFIAENADLLNKDVLKRWYSRARRESEVARHVFLMPDTQRQPG